MPQNNNILDDVSSVWILPEEEILWKGGITTKESLKAFFIVITLCVSPVIIISLIYSLTFQQDSYNISSLEIIAFIAPFILISFPIFFHYYYLNKEKYWVTKKYIFIKKGYSLKIQSFPLNLIQDVQHGIFKGQARQNDWIVIYFKEKITNPFLLLKPKVKEITIGPVENAADVVSIINELIT